MITMWTVPLPLIWRYRVDGPHIAGVVWSKTKGISVSVPNTMLDAFGNSEYVEHLPWELLDLTPWLDPADIDKPIIMMLFDIKLEITSRAIGQHGIGIKVVNPHADVEDAPTDFQQPSGSRWIQNTTQAAQYNLGTIRQWHSIYCAPYERMVKIGGCWRPASPGIDVDMAAEIHLEGYAIPA